MSADLLLYALIAAGLVFWLKNVLGTRHGDERERPNPYDSKYHEARESKVVALDGSDIEHEDGEGSDITHLFENPTDVLSIETKTAEQGLLTIAAIERDFEIKPFMQAAQDAFAIIVESFAEGDLETLGNLLAPSVYEAFSGAIKGREALGIVLETEIHAIKKAEIIDAEIEKKTAYITVRFTASETSVERDEEGEVISGHPDKVTEMRDVWVFGRKLKSRDPRWLVHETRGDFEGDNEIIPNSDGTELKEKAKKTKSEAKSKDE